MRLPVVRTFAPLLGAMLLFAAACGPSDLVGKEKLNPIKDGASPAEVAAVIGEGPLKALQPADSMRIFHGFRTQVFLSEGKSYRVIWYREKAGSIEDPITREVETPVLLENDKVIGKGWTAFDEKSKEYNLPNPYRSGERLDSISKSLVPNKN